MVFMSRFHSSPYLFTLILFFLSVTSWSVAKADTKAEFNEKLATPQLVSDLKQGGYVIYMRHGNTDNSRPDRVPNVDLNDCNTQRVLNEEGVSVTKQVGEYVRTAGVPIGDVFASPMCRAKNSALNAFGRYTLEPAIMYTGGMTTAQKKPVLDKTRELISQPIEKGLNRILVAHAPNMMDLMGYFPSEATLVIFKPKGNNQFDYLGSIRPQDWPDLVSHANSKNE